MENGSILLAPQMRHILASLDSVVSALSMCKDFFMYKATGFEWMYINCMCRLLLEIHAVSLIERSMSSVSVVRINQRLLVKSYSHYW